MTFTKYLPFVLYRQMPNYAQEIHDTELTLKTMLSVNFYKKNNLIYKRTLYHTFKQLANSLSR